MERDLRGCLPLGKHSKHQQGDSPLRGRFSPSGDISPVVEGEIGGLKLSL